MSGESPPANSEIRGKTASPDLSPGPDLQRLIAQGLQPPHSLPGWQLVKIEGELLGVPWCAYRRHISGQRFDLLPDLPRPETILRGRGGPHSALVLGLERGRLPHPGDLPRHERTNARRLLAAALIDIAGLPVSSKHSTDATDLLAVHAVTASKLASDGRQLWAALGAWPWFEGYGDLPADWSSRIGERAASELSVWLSQA